MQITGIVLAGGKSTRFGKDKALVQVNGKSLLENAVDICSEFCSTILISSNQRVHQVSEFKIVPDEFPGCGPIGGIYSGLKHSETAWNLVLSVDAPVVEKEFIRYLISMINNSEAVVPVSINGKEPLIALYKKSGLPEIKKRIQDKNYKMHDLLNNLEVKYIDSREWQTKFPQLFHNINRVTDLEEWV